MFSATGGPLSDVFEVATIEMGHSEDVQILETGSGFIEAIVNGKNVLFAKEEALRAIARRAVEQKTGARGLRSIMENIMMDTMYRAPSDESILKCIVTKEAAEGTEEPTLEIAEQRKRSVSKKAGQHSADESA